MRPGWTACLPPVRDAHHDSALFQEQDLLEERESLISPPHLRLEHGAAVQQLTGQTALRARPLHRRKQRGQRSAIFGARVFFEGAAQGQMLHFTLFRNPVSVGRQECEGIGRVAFVLGQMKSDAAHGIPGRVALFQIRRRPAWCPRDGRARVNIQFLPQPLEDGAVQILQALHGWRPLRQGGPLLQTGSGNAQLCGGLQIRVVAQRSEIAPGKLAPKGKRRWQRFLQEGRCEQLEPAR